MNVRRKGLVSVIISAVLFGILPLMAKIIYSQGCNAISLIFYRFFIVLPFLYIIIKRNPNESLKIKWWELRQIIIISVFGYAATGFLLFMSYKFIPSGLATTVHFTYPIFVLLGCIIFFKEKPNIVKITSLTLCFLGIWSFYKGNDRIDLLGLFLAFASGITYAFYTIYIGRSSLKKMDTFKLTFYLCLVSSIIIFIFSIAARSFIIDIQPLGWIMIMLLSLLAGLGAVPLYQIGIRSIGSQNTAILSTLEPITSIILSILILDEPYGIKTALGIIFILIAVLLIAIFENKDQDSPL